jgi:two-component system, OmpR family, sensor histidine kinase ArlS
VKLITKLTLYNTISKTVIVILFILLLPGLIKDVAFKYTNYSLGEQKKKVLDIIDKNGIDYYFQGDSSYGSYTMLKEEYIALEPSNGSSPLDTIETTRRIVDRDTLTYRVLSHVFEYGNKKYILEIGKTITAINQYNSPLQRVALYALAALIVLTLLFDLLFTRFLIRPLGFIIRTKLINRKFPLKDNLVPVQTTTTDFRYLDDSLIDIMNRIRYAFDKEREFTSNASHELMTPISILQNKMENLMVETELSEELQERITGMMNTLNRLKKIVRSLLLISRIENDQFTKEGEISPAEIVEDVVKELEDRVQSKDIRIRILISPEIKVKHLNRDLFFQLIFNLVNNAIKYNKDGGEINIYEMFIPGGGYSLVIEDTGIGIRENDIGTVFDRFKKSGETEGEGYGLGLSIVQTIARYHELVVEVKSVYGKGTVFSIHFKKGMAV